MREEHTYFRNKRVVLSLVYLATHIIYVWYIDLDIRFENTYFANLHMPRQIMVFIVLLVINFLWLPMRQNFLINYLFLGKFSNQL